MALNAVLGQSTPLVVKLGAPPAPGAITPGAGNATLGDFLFNTFSQNMRNQVVKSATPRRVELQATVGQPAFVSVGGRWGVVSTTIFHDSVVSSQRYLFADLSANNGTFVLASGATATPGAWQMLLGGYYDSGTTIRSLNTAVLGLVTVGDVLTLGGTLGALRLTDRAADGVYHDLYVSGNILAVLTSTGLIPLSVTAAGMLTVGGTQAGVTLNDRGNAHGTFVYRSANLVTYQDDTNGVVLTLGNTGALATAASNATAVGLRVPGASAPTVNLAEFDASALTNGQKTVFDKAGHLAASQAAAPTIVAGTGAGTTPTVSLAAGSTDQSGVIIVTTGTATPGGNVTLATITFKNAYATRPNAVILTPANAFAALASGATGPYVNDASTTTALFIVITGGTALTASTAYRWHYQVL